MATLTAPDTTAAQDSATRSMGHLALHYGKPEEGPAAAKLMRLLGFNETQMLPLPGGNFYRFVVNEHHYARGDGIVYLSAVPEPQARLVDAIHEAFKVGTGEEAEVVKGMRAMLASDPEASFHVGFLIDSLDELERMVLDLQERAESDPDLKGRVRFGFNRARPGDAAVDARLDASPVFGKITRCAYGRNGVQVFIITDLLKAGLLGEDMTLEFDYVFPGSKDHILSVVEM